MSRACMHTLIPLRVDLIRTTWRRSTVGAIAIAAIAIEAGSIATKGKRKGDGDGKTGSRQAGQDQLRTRV